MHVLFWIATGMAIGVAFGAAWGSRAARRAQTSRGEDTAPQAAQDLDALVATLGELERGVFARLLHRQRTARDITAEFEERLTFGVRLADRIAALGGSWGFITAFLAALLAWIAYNAERPEGFDPYPFILLNLVLSCLAALQAPVIMMSQNRMAAKDRIDARHDYEVNLKAEMEIMQLHTKIDDLQQRVDAARFTH